jgi:flagellar FliL protein
MPEVKEQTDVSQGSDATTRPKTAGVAELLPKVSIYGVVSLVAVFAAYLVTQKVIKPMTAQPPAAAAVEPAQPAATVEPAAGGSHDAGHHGSGDATGEESTFHTVESIVVNPAGTAGTRFLSCSVNFEVASKGDLKAFAALDVQIRDLLITILSSKTVEELADVTDRNRMRREMLSVINKLTAPAKAKAVYLTDFVLQ